MASKTRQAAGEIRGYFASQWKALRNYTDAQMQARATIEGLTLSPPDGEWVRFNILWGDGFVQTMGTTGEGKNELVGVVSTQVFVQPSSATGARTLEVMCDELRDLFNRQELTDTGVIRFGVPTPPRPVEDAGWVGRVIDVPFTFEETI